MKYVICYNIVDLSSRTICDVLITEKPISVLSDLDQKHYRIYLAEHEAPEGQSKAVFSESKMKLENGRTFGCKKIDLSEYNPILFEPDNDFETLHTGFALGLDLFNIPSTREDAMLLFSTEEGPSTWTRCIFEDVLELPNQILNVTVGWLVRFQSEVLKSLTRGNTVVVRKNRENNLSRLLITIKVMEW